MLKKVIKFSSKNSRVLLVFISPYIQLIMGNLPTNIILFSLFIRYYICHVTTTINMTIKVNNVKIATVCSNQNDNIFKLFT